VMKMRAMYLRSPHFISSRRRGRGAGGTSVGCTDRASQPGRICRNVIDVHETPMKITIDGRRVKACEPDL
jgi:hypothetical protein